MRNNILLTTACVLSLMTACSNPLGEKKSTIDPTYGPPTPAAATTPARTGYEMISGSSLAQPTNSARHKADVTVGASTTEIKLTTTRQKIVYLSVQGQIVSQ